MRIWNSISEKTERRGSAAAIFLAVCGVAYMGFEIRWNIEALQKADMALQVQIDRGFSEQSRDIAAVKTELAMDIAAVDTRLSGVDTRLSGEIAALRSEISDVRTVISSEISAVRAEIADVRAEVSAVRAEISDVRSEVSDVRAEVSTVNRRLDHVLEEKTEVAAATDAHAMAQ